MRRDLGRREGEEETRAPGTVTEPPRRGGRPVRVGLGAGRSRRAGRPSRAGPGRNSAKHDESEVSDLVKRVLKLHRVVCCKPAWHDFQQRRKDPTNSRIGAESFIGFKRKQILSS
jgi:hypothetical protein